jgi:site-specific DNA-cytosine methylase
MTCAVELNADAALVYGANHEHPVLQLNIADWLGVAHALKQYGPFDLVQWSPPCQPHSNANANKIANDPRNAVMLAAARLIKALKAPHFVMENVCGTASFPVWRHTKAFLKEAGYATTEYTVNANDCGVPQNRLRLFAVGSITATK